MKTAYMHSEEFSIMKELQLRAATVVELNEKIPIHIQSLRKLLASMQEEFTLTRKGYRKGSVLYAIDERLSRRVPYLKVPNENGTWVYRSLSELISAIGAETKGVKAAKFLPEAATRLLMIGARFHSLLEEMRNNGQDINNPSVVEALAKPILKDLRTLKVELKGHIDRLRNTLLLLEQLNQNDQFWDVSSLAKYFDFQIDADGQPIPQGDLHAVSDAFQLLSTFED